jgi:cytochrome c peroxidase
MNWKNSGILGATFLLLWAPALVAGGAPPDRTQWQEAYRRPAEIPFPEENPYSEAKAELGRKLFFDPILSGSGVRSCASCHNPGLSWGDGLPRAVGEGQATMALRAPTLIDIAWIPRLGWDGKFRDLESVAFGPITSRANMNSPESTLIARLSSISGYVGDFTVAFGKGPITRENIELALATFERSIVSEQAPFDRWIAGDEAAIDAAAKRVSTSSTAKGAARSATANLRSATALFTTSGRPRTKMWGVAGFFRIRRSCNMRSRLRRCAMWRAARPICTMARSRHWKP